VPSVARGLLVALLVIVSVLGCTYRDVPVIGAQSKSPPPVGAGGAAARPSDLPGTVICAASGPADFYLRQGGPNTDGLVVKQVVERQRSRGLADNWVQVLAPAQIDCTALVNGSAGYSEPDAFNFVMRFRRDSDAQAAQAQGFGTLRSGGLDVTAGAATGLGPDSVARPTAKGYAAFWRKGVNVSYLSVEGVSQDQGRRVAVATNARIHN
jgi:hypothetical protein